MIKFLKKLFNIDSFIFNHPDNGEPEYFAFTLTKPIVPQYSYASVTTTSNPMSITGGGTINNATTGGASYSGSLFTSTYTMMPASDEIKITYDEKNDKIRMEMGFTATIPGVCIHLEKDAIPEMLVSLIKVASEQNIIEDNPTLQEAYERFLMIAKLSL